MAKIDKLPSRKTQQRVISQEPSANGGGSAPRRYRLLKDLGGRLQVDPEFDRILVEQRRIDPDLWE